MTAPVPANDAERVVALRNYQIMDSAPELAYDELTEIAAQLCQCPVALIGFIDESREWLKSKYGLPPQLTQVPREMTVCSATICGSDVLLVEDLAKDERFAEYPAIAGPPHFRFYCGMPLINPEGYALGTICILDFQPREITFEQVESVRRLSHQVVTQLELRRSLLERDQAMRDLERVRAAIEAERAKADRLLLNILPKAIAEELKQHDRVAPRYYDSVTVLFADFEGFTKLSERMEPKGLVEQLDQYFSTFEEIGARHRLEKLKTIGDAYMCAGGLPEANRTHCVDTCLAALEMLDVMAQTNRQRDKLRLPRWELRVGVHTGPAMAGVVGKRKFLYDVWGDSVNVAARMESAGSAGRVNVSEAVHNRLKPLFDFESRGSVEAKGKGPLAMHYLVRIKPELSREGAGRVPNDAFHHECARLFPGYVP